MSRCELCFWPIVACCRLRVFGSMHLGVSVCVEQASCVDVLWIESLLSNVFRVVVRQFQLFVVRGLCAGFARAVRVFLSTRLPSLHAHACIALFCQFVRCFLNVFNPPWSGQGVHVCAHIGVYVLFALYCQQCVQGLVANESTACGNSACTGCVLVCALQVMLCTCQRIECTDIFWLDLWLHSWTSRCCKFCVFKFCYQCAFAKLSRDHCFVLFRVKAIVFAKTGVDSMNVSEETASQVMFKQPQSTRLCDGASTDASKWWIETMKCMFEKGEKEQHEKKLCTVETCQHLWGLRECRYGKNRNCAHWQYVRLCEEKRKATNVFQMEAQVVFISTFFDIKVSFHSIAIADVSLCWRCKHTRERFQEFWELLIGDLRPIL